jgi:hypothetical protein
MNEQVQPILDALRSRHNDRRLHVFDVRIGRAADGVVELAGRVLERENLNALRRELAVKLPAVRVDDSAVAVLEREPRTMRVVATNLTDLHVEPSFLSEMLTQVTNGTELEILEDREKWCFVRQRDGYMGWAYTAFQEPAPATPVKFTHVVAMHSAHVHATARPRGGAEPLTRLPGGTFVRAADPRDADAAIGNINDNIWIKIQPVGARLPGGYVLLQELRPLSWLPLPAGSARGAMIWDARHLIGVYYLWGGCTGWGIDCSGLAQLVHKLNGYAIPRDCDLQFAAGKAVEPPFRAGDLLYFHNEARTKVGHVGIATGDGWRIIHSSRSRNGVYEEDVQVNENLRASYAGARTFLPA